MFVFMEGKQVPQLLSYNSCLSLTLYKFYDLIKMACKDNLILFPPTKRPILFIKDIKQVY